MATSSSPDKEVCSTAIEAVGITIILFHDIMTYMYEQQELHIH